MKFHLRKWLKGALAVSLLMGTSLVHAEDLGGPVYSNEGIPLYEQVLGATGLQGNNGDAGGNSVAVDGEWAFVANTDRCQVFVYKWDAVTFRWGDGAGNIGDAYTTLVKSGGSCQAAAVRDLGYSLSTDNGMVVVGAPEAALSSSDRYGMVYLFKFDYSKTKESDPNVDDDTADNRRGWIRIGTVEQAYDYVGAYDPTTNPDPVIDTQDFSWYGRSVSIRFDEAEDKAILVIGAPHYSDVAGSDTFEGKVYIWEWDNDPQVQAFELVDGQIGENAGDQVGTSVTSNGTELMASAPYFDNAANPNSLAYTDSGAVYLFGYDVATHSFTPEHRFESGVKITPPVGPAFIMRTLSNDFHLGMNLSYAGHIMGMSGTDSFVLEHTHGSSGTMSLKSAHTGTNEADITQSGNVINISQQGEGTKDGKFNVYFDKNQTDGTPNVSFTKTEEAYGEDISLSLPRLLVNGQNSIHKGGKGGVAYAYTPTCGTGGELIANEWQVIGLQCEVSNGTSAAGIDEMFSGADNLGTWGVDWGMYSREAPNYDGHSSSYHWMESTEPMQVGVGYWIVWLGTGGGDGKYSVKTPLTATNIVKRPEYSVALRTPEVAAITTLDLKALMTAAGTPYGRGGSGSYSDFRVLLSNPLLKDTLFSQAGWATTTNGVEGFATLNHTGYLFEDSKAQVWVYDPSANWWEPVVETAGTGFKTTIAPGQGFNIKLSHDYYLEVLANSDVSSDQFGLTESK